jgi:hypothetical protein
MYENHAKREIVKGDKAIGSRRTLSRESSDKYKEESSSSIKSHRKGDNLYYYEEGKGVGCHHVLPSLCSAFPARYCYARIKK